VTAASLRALNGRVQMMVGRAVLSTVKDDTKLQELQVELLEDEVHDGVEHFTPYGFTAHPRKGAEAIMLAVGGLRSHGLVISVADRRYRLRNPVRGGAASDYVSWALEVAEVTRAWVYENWNGLGTVKVLFVMDGRPDIIPTGDDVTLVAAHIAPLRPVCADVTVAAPIATPLDLTIHLVPDTTATRAAVSAELADLIAREAEPGGTILLSHIREAISLAAGETDHTLTVPSGNVTAAAGHISTFGTITWA
jgi:hypothetical protein